MQELVKAISDDKQLQASWLITKKFSSVEDSFDLDSELALLSEKMSASVSGCNQDLKLQCQMFIDTFFSTLLFSIDTRLNYSSKTLLLNKVLSNRTGDPVSLSIVFCELAKQCGLQASGVNFPGCFLIRLESSPDSAIFIDPLTRRICSFQQLQVHYQSLFEQENISDMPEEALNPASSAEVVIKLLQELKTAFLYEDNLAQALEVIELLIFLCPEDPYERRDRGFLLQQLECTQMAKLDYQYFIHHCPTDPDAQFLKTQIQNWDSQIQQIWH